jgi:hypothetical protein
VVSHHAVPAIVAALVLVAQPAAFAQQPTPAPHAANTRHATLQERHHSGTHGDVTLIPHGNKTEVQLHLAKQHSRPAAVTLHSGQDCLDTIGPAAMSFPLNPINGTASNTLISVPLSSIGSKHFVVDVRNATHRAAFAEACAKL